MDSFGGVEPQASLSLIVNHREHVLTVLPVSLSNDEETARQRSSGGFSDGDLQGGEVNIDMGRDREEEERTFGSLKAVHRLSSRSGTFSYTSPGAERVSSRRTSTAA